MTLDVSPFMTKPRARVRFLLGAHDGRLQSVLRLPCGGEVYYLREKPCGALWRLAVGKGEYDPAVDVDRYAVACPLPYDSALDEEAHVCPAWDALRREMDFVKNKGVGNDGFSVAVDVERGFEDDDARWSGVYEEHGYCGPIVEHRKPIGARGVAHIVTAAEECERRREHGSDGGDCGKGKGKDVVNGAETVHEGIIAKIKRRLFG